MIDILILLAIAVIVLIAGWYVLSQVPLPEPARKIISIVGVVIVAVIAVAVLLKISGRSDLLWLGHP